MTDFNWRLLGIAAGAFALAACGGGSESAEEAAPAADIAVVAAVGPLAWEVDRAASSITFRATQNDKVFEGVFSRWNASILMDLEAPEAEGAITTLVDLASVDAGTKDRNEALPQEGWFHIALHPVARYESSAIMKTGDGSYAAEGTLTIKGMTQPVSMPFTLTVGDDGRAVADGSVMLDRSVFGIGQGEFKDGKWVGLEVEVLLHIEAAPAG